MPDHVKVTLHLQVLAHGKSSVYQCVVEKGAGPTQGFNALSGRERRDAIAALLSFILHQLE